MKSLPFFLRFSRWTGKAARRACFWFCLLFLFCTACQDAGELRPETKSFAPALSNRSSVINIPISYKVNDLEKEINQAIGEVFIDDNSFEGDNVKMKVQRLSDIQVSFKGDVIFLEVPLRIDCEGRVNKKFLGMKLDKTQKADFEVKLHLKSKVDIDETWQLITNTELLKLEWLKKPKVKFALISIPVDKLIEKQLEKRQDKLLRQLDRLARLNIDIKRPIEQVYSNIQRPILLSNELSNVWLNVQPSKVAIGKLNGNSQQLRIDAAIEANIFTTLQEKQPKIGKRTLPNKSKSEHPSGHIDLNIFGELKFDEVNKVLANQLVGKQFDLKKRSIRIDSIKAFGSGEMLMIEADLSGDLEGKVFLNGKPMYDNEKKELFVDNFDFELKSRAFILKAADWLYHDNFIKQIEKELRLPLSNEISQIPGLINMAIEQGELKDKLSLDIKQMDFSAQDIRVQEHGVQTLIKVNGKAGMQLRQVTRSP